MNVFELTYSERYYNSKTRRSQSQNAMRRENSALKEERTKKWRKRVGVEPTPGVLALSLDLKSRRDTGPHALPLNLLSDMPFRRHIIDSVRAPVRLTENGVASNLCNKRPEHYCQGPIWRFSEGPRVSLRRFLRAAASARPAVGGPYQRLSVFFAVPARVMLLLSEIRNHQQGGIYE